MDTIIISMSILFGLITMGLFIFSFYALKKLNGKEDNKKLLDNMLKNGEINTDTYLKYKEDY